jgi:hypothetical protein
MAYDFGPKNARVGEFNPVEVIFYFWWASLISSDLPMVKFFFLT